MISLCRHSQRLRIILLCTGITLIAMHAFSFRCAALLGGSQEQQTLDTPETEMLHVCRTPAINKRHDNVLKMLYQCRGPEYEEFGMKMYSFANNPIVHGPTWGQRQFPLPDNSQVLMIGNSHTRQVGEELACQYSHKLLRMWLKGKTLSIFTFNNNATMYLMTNSVLVYSYQWKDLIEQELRKKLEEFDAVVLGLFNPYLGNVTTNFDKGMIQQSKRYANVDYLTIPAPTQWQFIANYPGPLAILSMFTKWDDVWIQLEGIANAHRDRVVALNARKYVPFLGECGSDTREGVSKCYDDGMKNMGKHKPNGMHRCVGPHGGHPDLVAWDVIEFLHTLKKRPALGK